MSRVIFPGNAFFFMRTCQAGRRLAEGLGVKFRLRQCVEQGWARANSRRRRYDPPLPFKVYYDRRMSGYFTVVSAVGVSVRRVDFVD